MGKYLQQDWTSGTNRWLDAVKARAKYDAATGKYGKDFCVTAEAAAILAVSDNYIRNAIEDGRLHAVNLNTGTGRVPFWRIATADLVAFAERVSKGI